MKNRLAPIALSMGLLGLVGGIAAASAFGGGDAPEPKRQVQLVQPAAETVTPSPTTTTAAPKAPAPAVKKKAPAVSSSKRSSTAPSTVQRQAIVSEPAPTTPQAPAPAAPPVKWGPAGPPPNPEAPAAK